MQTSRVSSSEKGEEYYGKGGGDCIVLIWLSKCGAMNTFNMLF